LYKASANRNCQAIVDGEPPDLPKDGFSDAARNFVRGCLHKVPKLRPTYAMLLKHAWLKPLVAAPSIIEEEEEEEDEEQSAAAVATPSPEEIKSPVPNDVVDREVAEWVIQALEKKRLGRMAKSEKPALHAAPLDAMVSPAAEKSLGNGTQQPASEETKSAHEQPSLIGEEPKPVDEEPKSVDEEPKSVDEPVPPPAE
jgi:serine/threonine protein kinase